MSSVDNPLHAVLPPDSEVIAEAQRLLNDTKTKVDSLRTCIARDPVLVIEILKRSNSVQGSAGKTQVVSIEQGIINLGVAALSELLYGLKERPQYNDPDMKRWYSQHRDTCVKSAAAARIIAEAVARTLASAAYTSGLFSALGEMIAVASLRSRYVAIAEELELRGKIVYHLLQEYNFDIDTMGAKYLQHNGIPGDIIATLDRSITPPNQDISTIRSISSAAAELVDAYQSERWDRYEPGKKIPSKSAMRMLQLSDQEYERLYNTLDEFFKGKSVAEVIEETSSEEDLPEFVPSEPEAAPKKQRPGVVLSEPEPLAPKKAAPPAPTPPKTPEPPAVATEIETDITTPEQLAETLKECGVEPAALDPAEEAAIKEFLSGAPQGAHITWDFYEPPPTLAKRVDGAIGCIMDRLDSAQDKKELLEAVLDSLIVDGFCSNAAIIKIADDLKTATVLVGRGKGVSAEGIVKINDENHPLSRCFSKVQLFGSLDQKYELFGSKSFALAPIDAVKNAKLALYADAGETAISLSARRIFRRVLEVLNDILPEMPGEINLTA